LFLPVAQAAAKTGASAEFQIGSLRLIVKQGDITDEKVDVIINSSNSGLDLSRGKQFRLCFIATVCVCFVFEIG
jgi:hypothetical protein